VPTIFSFVGKKLLTAENAEIGAENLELAQTCQDTWGIPGRGLVFGFLCELLGILRDLCG
jgi:hypothetical protein